MPPVACTQQLPARRLRPSQSTADPYSARPPLRMRPCIPAIIRVGRALRKSSLTAHRHPSSSSRPSTSPGDHGAVHASSSPPLLSRPSDFSLIAGRESSRTTSPTSARSLSRDPPERQCNGRESYPLSPSSSPLPPEAQLPDRVRSQIRAAISTNVQHRPCRFVAAFPLQQDDDSPARLPP